MFKKRFMSILLAFLMVLTMIPLTAVATESENVYISISYDGQFIEDQNGAPIAYVPVPMSELEAIKLDAYGLEEYYYDGDGDGNYDVTALYLYIYTHENIFGLEWSDVRISGGAGSIFFEEGLFGFEDCNLNYYFNGVYPEISPGWGATADNLILENGDFCDIAGYTSWNFYSDSAAGFHYFADGDGNITHTYTAEAGNELSIKLVRTGGGFGGELSLTDIGDYTVSYGTTLGTASGTVTTDGSGEAVITDLKAGTWYLWCDGGYGAENPLDIVSAPAYAEVTVTGTTETDPPAEPEGPREPQDVSGVLNATMAQLAATVTAPAFGTNAGEWTVLSLARGEYYTKENAYFADYYDRIVEYVNEEAASVNLNGALHKSKSTDNSRVILALSSIGKDATSVGDWNLIMPYNDFSWIKKQGINGVIFALLALDTNDYQTTDTTIRQQCIDFILDKQLTDGGWALSGTTFNSDITGMTLQALYPYRETEAVAEAAEKAFDVLAANQLETGGYTYGSDGETLESVAQVIVACTTWGINPDTDIRFIKNGNSAIDNLLTYYIPEEAMFKHALAGNSNNMATDQACYALVSYNRLVNAKTALYDMSDVTFEQNQEIVAGEPVATISLPEQIACDKGTTFKAVISLDQWDNNAGYKMIDFIVNVPEGLSVTDVAAENRLNGGAVSYHLEDASGKLRIVYFDASEHSDLTVSGTAFPVSLFTITFKIDKVTQEGYVGTEDTALAIDEDGYQWLQIGISGMSIKKSSDSADETAMVVVNTSNASGAVGVVKGLAYSAICLYTGDDIDLIPSSKMAVAVAVAGGEEDATKLIYNDGTNEYEFKYSAQISEKTSISTYIALVDASIKMTQFTAKTNFVMTKEEASEVTFGDVNGDGLFNAQDALNTVDTWLRKTDAPADDVILAMNVNGDSRINTFDALGMVEAYIDSSEYIIITQAATLNGAK